MDRGTHKYYGCNQVGKYVLIFISDVKFITFIKTVIIYDKYLN